MLVEVASYSFGRGFDPYPCYCPWVVDCVVAGHGRFHDRGRGRWNVLPADRCRERSLSQCLCGVVAHLCKTDIATTEAVGARVDPYLAKIPFSSPSHQEKIHTHFFAVARVMCRALCSKVELGEVVRDDCTWGHRTYHGTLEATALASGHAMVASRRLSSTA